MNREWQKFEKDKTCLVQYANMGDGYLLDYNEVTGFTLYCFLNHISPVELECISSSKSDFEITFTDIKGCGFITLTFGALPIGDCVFDPRLYKNERFIFEEINNSNTMGVAFNIVVVDPSRNGLIRGMRVIGLDRAFSLEFLDWCRKTAEKSITKTENNAIVDEVFAKYSSNDIKRMATSKWKLTHRE